MTLKNLDALRAFQDHGSFWYVATPYTNYSGGHHTAYMEAVHFTADLLRMGVHAYSPIVHGHPLAVHGALSKSHGFWMPFCHLMLDQAAGLIVFMMDGWRESRGVTEEIAMATKLGMPIWYVAPETYRVFSEAPELLPHGV